MHFSAVGYSLQISVQDFPSALKAMLNTKSTAQLHFLKKTWTITKPSLDKTENNSSLSLFLV